MIQRRIASNMLFTSFLIKRDLLCANMNRISCGFTPPSVINEAREQIRCLTILLDEMVKIKDAKWDDMVPYSREELEKRFSSLK